MADLAEIIRRAQARRAMGRGGAATTARLSGVKAPRASINDPNAPTAIGGTRQPVSGTPRKPRVSKARPSRPAPATAAPMANADDRKLLDAATQLQFGGQRAALGQQLQQNTRFTSGLGDWYANAVNEMRSMQAAQHTQAQQTLGQVQAYNSPATLANPADQQAANARNNLNAQFANQFARDEGANSAAMDRLAAAMHIQEANTRNQANAERLGLIGQQGQLAAQEGAFRTTTLADLDAARAKAEQAQRDYDFKVAVAQNADLLKQGQLQVQNRLADSLIGDRTAGQKVARSNARTKRAQLIHSEAVDRHDSMLADSKYQLDVQKFGQADAKDKYQRKHGLGPYKPPAAATDKKPAKVPESVRHQQREVLVAEQKYRSGIKAGVPLHEIAASARQHGIIEPILGAGADLATKGYISPQNVAKLRKIGITVPKSWTVPG